MKTGKMFDTNASHYGLVRYDGASYLVFGKRWLRWLR